MDQALVKAFIDSKEATSLMENLKNALPWQQTEITVFGKKHPIPRLNAWVGAPDANMVYSKTTFYPKPWTEPLLRLKHKIETWCQHPFNSVLANLYRNGQDKMGWHSDDEKELGTNPFIASLSLGPDRDFVMKHKTLKHQCKVHLQHGDLLTMYGTTQHHYKHALPQRLRLKIPRINLTFRQIIKH